VLSIIFHRLFYVFKVEREKNEDSLPSKRSRWKDKDRKGLANHHQGAMWP